MLVTPNAQRWLGSGCTSTNVMLRLSDVCPGMLSDKGHCWSVTVSLSFPSIDAAIAGNPKICVCSVALSINRRGSKDLNTLFCFVLFSFRFIFQLNAARMSFKWQRRPGRGT